MQVHRTWVEINERAITHNIETLRSLLESEARFCAVLKSNAYGHGMLEVARIASRSGVDAFAVDSIDEALLLRKDFPSALIIVLGYTVFDRYLDAIENNIQITLYDKEGIRHGESVAQKRAKELRVHIKLETGTHRQGVMPDDVSDVFVELQRAKHVRVVGLSTHFANIEDSSNPQYATLQFGKFKETVEHILGAGFSPEHIHCACSAAIILYPDTHGTLVRAGISMYGIWSSEVVSDTVRTQHLRCDLRPALTWKTRIAQVKTVAMGTPVGYGLSETMKRSGRIAVIPVGYWDGYDRGLSSTGEVLVKGYRCKIVGRICMNMCMIDVSSVPSVEKEDEVILLGRAGRHGITADSIAKKTQTIPYEVVTRINPFIPRIITSGTSQDD
jgi:alanine racemase